MGQYLWNIIAFMIGSFVVGWIVRDFQYYMKNGKSKQKEVISIQEGVALKEGEYQPIFIKIDKNEMGGYTSFVYNRHATHLTKENRQHFVNILHYMILKENELRSHKFQLLTFKKDK